MCKNKTKTDWLCKAQPHKLSMKHDASGWTGSENKTSLRDFETEYNLGFCMLATDTKIKVRVHRP